MRHRAQRLHFHRTAQRDIVGAAAGNFLCRRAAGRQRVVQVDIDFQAFCADGNLLHFLCGGDPSFGQQPPQRQLRQKLGCAYHPEGRLFIYIDNCGVFCWNGRFRAVRHPYGFKGGCCAEEVVYLHGGPFSVQCCPSYNLSVCFAASSPGRGASGEPGNSELDAGSPIWRKMAGLATEGSSFWTMHLVKLP